MKLLSLFDGSGGQMSWNYDEIAMTLRAQSKHHEPIVVLQTNAKLKAYGFDSYNQTIDEELTQSLRSSEGGDTKPKVIITLADVKTPLNG